MSRQPDRQTVTNALDLREAAVLLIELRELKFERRTFDDATRLPRCLRRRDPFASD